MSKIELPYIEDNGNHKATIYLYEPIEFGDRKTNKIKLNTKLDFRLSRIMQNGENSKTPVDDTIAMFCYMMDKPTQFVERLGMEDINCLSDFVKTNFEKKKEPRYREI